MIRTARKPKPERARESLTYAEQLKHPEWQRVRLEVMQRAAFMCEECGDTERELHIHHTYYQKGRKVWEYNQESLRCLCQGCHLAVETALLKLHQAIGPLGSGMIYQVAAFAVQLQNSDWFHRGEQTPPYTGT